MSDHNEQRRTQVSGLGKHTSARRTSAEGGTLKPFETGNLQFDSETPAPLEEEAMRTGEFKRLSEEEHLGRGKSEAQARKAHARDDSSRRSLKVTGIVFAVLAVVLLFFGIALFNTMPTSLDGGDSSLIDQTQVDADDSIEYDNYIYSTAHAENGGGYVFERTRTGETPLQLFALEGKPVTCILYNGAFIIPQNIDGSFVVQTWTVGDGSQVSELTDVDGAVVGGVGSVASANLEGEQLLLTFDDGATQTVRLSD